MLTLLASLLGIFGNVLPNIVAIWEKKVDAETQTQLLELQAKIALDKDQFDALVAQNQALIGDRENARSMDSGSTGYRFLDFLRAAIRPIFAYSFFCLFLFCKILIIYHMMNGGIPGDVAISSALDTETKEFFVSIFAFYFGGAVSSNLLTKK
jgi:hypothetical protein